MDLAEPPRIVLESLDACADSGRAQDVLRHELAPARAPGSAWTVQMRVQRTKARALKAVGTIMDADGVTVAQRVLSGGTTGCEGLARAVAVWASLVLDEELARTRPATSAASSEPAAAPTPEMDSSPWPPPAVEEKPSPEADWYLHRDEPRTLELGVGAFLMGGTGASPIAGVTPYVVAEVGDGIFLRPALAFGETGSTPGVMWVAARLDTCLRLPGLYTTHRGIQLDVCGGADVGATSFGLETLAFVAPGPSIDLRGELGGSLAVAVRGVAGINLVRPTGGDVDVPPVSARGELTLSWSLR